MHMHERRSMDWIWVSSRRQSVAVSWLLVDELVDEVGGVLDGGDALGVVLLDGDLELLLQRHDDLHRVQRVGAEVRELGLRRQPHVRRQRQLLLHDVHHLAHRLRLRLCTCVRAYNNTVGSDKEKGVRNWALALALAAATLPRRRETEGIVVLGRRGLFGWWTWRPESGLVLRFPAGFKLKQVENKILQRRHTNYEAAATRGM